MAPSAHIMRHSPSIVNSCSTKQGRRTGSRAGAGSEGVHQLCTPHCPETSAAAVASSQPPEASQKGTSITSITITATTTVEASHRRHRSQPATPTKPLFVHMQRRTDRHDVLSAHEEARHPHTLRHVAQLGQPPQQAPQLAGLERRQARQAAPDTVAAASAGRLG